MKILAFTTGVESVYHGSGLRDNALATELVGLGHSVALIPIYSRPKLEGPSMFESSPVVFCGFRGDEPQKQKKLAEKLPPGGEVRPYPPTNPQELGRRTVAMLEGAQGPGAVEYGVFQEWLKDQPRPDVVMLPSTLFISLARTIRAVYETPVVCTMQGEDQSLEQLVQPHFDRAVGLIREQIGLIDVFISTSDAYAEFMCRLLGMKRDRVVTVPPGVDPARFKRVKPDGSGPFRLGYLARIAPEKGLHHLAEAWTMFKRHYASPAELHVAGSMGAEGQAYLEPLFKTPDLIFHGELDFEAKREFLSSLDAFCVAPARDDAKAIYVLEALASGVAVVAPGRMAVAEHIGACGGGILVKPGSPKALAKSIMQLAENRNEAHRLGQRGREGALGRRTLRQMAERTMLVFECQFV